MKPVQSTTTQVDNLPGETVDFTISNANAAWIMRSLADLYSNRELAVIREYSTNARDAMIEAGRADQPIEVTLPSMTNPRFIVKDTGVGMTRRELAETYTQFGESTKRDSNDYNGLLGFGSKSAVAYTNTFTITSVKDGYKNVGVITRSEDSMGGYIIKLKFVIDNLETHEANGTTIEVPVHNYAEFTKKANDFYRFWKPGTVLCNGVQPEWAVGTKLDEGLFISKANQSFVVMGNVAYPIVNPGALFPKGMNHIYFVAYVDNGVVEFTPNREALKYSEHTKQSLHRIIGDFCDTAVRRAKEEIANAKTHWEAFNAWDSWVKIVGAQNVPDLYFRGEKLADHMVVDGWKYVPSRYRYTTDKITQYRIDMVPKTLFVTEFGLMVNSDQKKKAREYAALKGINASVIVFTQGKIASPWVDPGRVVTWDALKLALPATPKAPRAPRVASGRLAGSFDLVSRTGIKYEQAVPSTKDLYFVTVQEYNGSKNLSSVLDDFGLDHEVVKVPANRMAKFMRHYSHAKPVWPYLETLVVLNGKSLLSADALAYLELTSGGIRKIRGFNPDRIDDPVLKEQVRLARLSQDSLLKDYNKHKELAKALGLSFIPYNKVQFSSERKVYPLAKYPILEGYYEHASKLEHVYLYVNAVYAARKSGKIV